MILNLTHILRTCKGEDAVGGEVELVAEQVAHAVDVVDAALELVLGEGVADADEERALLAAPVARVAGRQPVRVAGAHGLGGRGRRLRRRGGGTEGVVEETLDEAHGLVQAALVLRPALHAGLGVAESAPDGARARRSRQGRAAVSAPCRPRMPRPRARHQRMKER